MEKDKTEAGDLYSFGDGKDGCLGHYNFESVAKPTQISYFMTNKLVVCKMACGAGHILCMT